MTAILPSYRHIINPKLKYIYLSFDGDGSLVIKSPKISQQEIEKTLIKKSAWISRSRQKLLAKKGKPLQFNEDDKVYYLGRDYSIEYIESQKPRTILKFGEKIGFFIIYNQFDTDTFTQKIEQFYKNKAQEIIPNITQAHADKMQLYPSKVSFRKAKRQWGSCSVKNAISFNYLMMKLPLDVIQYIIVHELAHIKHKHHQKEFWELVAIYMPNYKKYQLELKFFV